MSGKLTKAKEAWASAKDFWKRRMWTEEASQELPRGVGPILVGVARSLYIVVDAFRQDRVRLRAAALTFATLLSLVPFLAVAFSLFTAFGGLEDVGNTFKGMIVDALAVQQREVVMEYLDKFIGGANAGGLGAVGSAALFVTAVSTLSTIETAFNDIWGVSEARGWIRRFQVYLPIVLLGPVLIGVAFSSIVALEASEYVKMVTDAAPALKALFGLGPLLVYVLLFFFLYLFVPNTRVHVGPALAGGLVGGISLGLGQRVFTAWAANAVSYSAIYGSFGAIPLTILWINVSWTLVLLGATVSFAVQSSRTFAPERKFSPTEREKTGAQLLLAVARHYHAGAGPMPAQDLIDQALVPPHLGRRLLEEMSEAKLLVKVVGEDDEVGFVPGRPLEALTLADLVRSLRGALPDVEDGADEPGLTMLRQAAENEEAELRQATLHTLIALHAASTGEQPAVAGVGDSPGLVEQGFEPIEPAPHPSSPE